MSKEKITPVEMDAANAHGHIPIIGLLITYSVLSLMAALIVVQQLSLQTSCAR